MHRVRLPKSETAFPVSSARELFSTPDESDVSLTSWRASLPMRPAEAHGEHSPLDSNPATTVRRKAEPANIDQQVLPPRSQAAREAASVAGRLSHMPIRRAVEELEELVTSSERPN
eukprot:scaffold309252_cov43-Prasinocladus_malaysianus.AAC.1